MFYADCTKSADRQVNAVKKLFSIICRCLPDVFQEGNRSVSIGLATTSGMVWLLLRGAIEQQNDAGLFWGDDPSGQEVMRLVAFRKG
jgi:hypothetical protein